MDVVKAAFSAANTVQQCARRRPRWRSRQYMAELDDRTLKDIGITRADAEYELNKPFWRA
jgi:uncharacterized protein YjiS (DUF1127 family)